MNHINTTPYKIISVSILLALLAACGGESSDASTGAVNEPIITEPTNPTSGTAPQELIANAFSGTSIGLAWFESGESHTVYRDGEKIGETQNNYYLDEDLSENTIYSYSITTEDASQTSDPVIAKTLINSTNSAQQNGAETVITNDRLINFSACNINSGRDTSIDVAETDLDACLGAMLAHNNMAGHLEDMRAFSARVRSEQSRAMVDLGMRLFHSKSLSANGDTACSSCHHPALGCGGDDLSMPVGVNALDTNVLGPGRSDGTHTVPIVPRNSQATCNSVLWRRGLFWDNRVVLQNRGVSTGSNDVDTNTDNAVGTGTLALLMAQAHFPVTAAPEMGDVAEFGYDSTSDQDLTQYRETILAANLSPQDWGDLFTAGYGDATINYSKIAQALAAYEAVQLFIDNPFFDYVDGDVNAISSDEKRGAITFMDSSTGCTFCHSGAFFTTEAVLPGNYPQIGVGKAEDGSGRDTGAVGLSGPGAFRSPTLLNVAITGPWGHNGQFGTLKRNVQHYQDHGASITNYFANDEMCELEQFKNLSNCATEVAPNGLALSQEILAGNVEFSNNISDAEVDLVVKFLETLTDPDAANPNSNAIQSLIPPRDGGPDNKQLDAKDINENAL